MSEELSYKELISHYNLIKHPEGGYFTETYRSNGIIPKSVLPKEFSGDRNFSTSILFLLPEGDTRQLHRDYLIDQPTSD